MLPPYFAKFARFVPPVGDRLSTYLTCSYTAIFLLTDVEIWSKIRPALKCDSCRIVLGQGPSPPISTLLSSVPGTVGPYCHGQKESRIEETLCWQPAISGYGRTTQRFI